MKRQTQSMCFVVAASRRPRSGCLAARCRWLGRNRMSRRQRSEPVDLFDGMKNGKIDAKVVPLNDHQARIFITNKTRQPLSIKLPEAFAAVPLAQFGGGGGGGRGGGGGGEGEAARDRARAAVVRINRRAADWVAAAAVAVVVAAVCSACRRRRRPRSMRRRCAWIMACAILRLRCRISWCRRTNISIGRRWSNCSRRLAAAIWIIRRRRRRPGT